MNVDKFAKQLYKKFGPKIADWNLKTMRANAIRMGVPLAVFQDAISTALQLFSNKKPIINVKKINEALTTLWRTLIEDECIKEKEYKVSYVIKNPPPYAKKNPDVWEQAFYEYLRRQGVRRPEIAKTVDNVEWNEVVRIYNTLIGKKNRDRRPGFTKKKNTDLKVASRKY